MSSRKAKALEIICLISGFGFGASSVSIDSRCGVCITAHQQIRKAGIPSSRGPYINVFIVSAVPEHGSGVALDEAKRRRRVPA
jgi:hypothetical protein